MRRAEDRGGGAIDALAERIERKVEEPPFLRDASFLRRLLPLMRLWSAYFGGEVRGFEKLPERGPMLVVGNHSGGVLVPDVSVFIAAWYEHRGLDEPLVGLALDAIFAIPGVETLMRKLGEVPANPENAARALAEGASVLVYPGGAHETFRPYGDRNRIDFGGHKGFVRLALQTGVPVVPLVGHGGHESIVVLARGDALARRLGFERLRLRVAPIIWQVPWGISTPLQLGLPLPAKITMQLGEPLDWSRYGPAAAGDPEVVDRCYEEITGRMQATLTRLAEERPRPILSRLRELLP